jgi:Complex I intermediate-associated protein 30 (CIA30)
MKFEFTNIRRAAGCLALFLLVSVAASLGAKSARAQDAAKPAAPTPTSASSGLISDFDNGTAETKFGMAWVISTDTIMGGKSSGEMKVVDGGANKDPHSLDVAGTISGDLPFAWAGVMFSPGDQPFAPVNLAAHKSISFWAKGDGQTYRILVFTASGGRMPAQQTFEAGKEWKKITFPFSDFNGTDGHDIAAILFVGGPAAGKFDFQIDEIKLD